MINLFKAAFGRFPRPFPTTVPPSLWLQKPFLQSIFALFSKHAKGSVMEAIQLNEEY